MSLITDTIRKQLVTLIISIRCFKELSNVSAGLYKTGKIE